MRHYFAQRIIKTLLQITVFRDLWREPGLLGFNNRGASTDQPRTNRGFHRHFLKIELVWVVRLGTCCSDNCSVSSLILAITIEQSV